jgi:hypothetical protein
MVMLPPEVPIVLRVVPAVETPPVALTVIEALAVPVIELFTAKLPVLNTMFPPLVIAEFTVAVIVFPKLVFPLQVSALAVVLVTEALNVMFPDSIVNGPELK